MVWFGSVRQVLFVCLVLFGQVLFGQNPVWSITSSKLLQAATVPAFGPNGVVGAPAATNVATKNGRESADWATAWRATSRPSQGDAAAACQQVCTKSSATTMPDTREYVLRVVQYVFEHNFEGGTGTVYKKVHDQYVNFIQWSFD